MDSGRTRQRDEGSRYHAHETGGRTTIDESDVVGVKNVSQLTGSLKVNIIWFSGVGFFCSAIGRAAEYTDHGGGYFVGSRFRD